MGTGNGLGADLLLNPVTVVAAQAEACAIFKNDGIVAR